MAFFTRTDLGAPAVGEEDELTDLGEVRSESSTLTRGETLVGLVGETADGDESSSDDEGDADSRTVEGRESPANQIFDYVVDRTLGVQV